MTGEVLEFQVGTANNRDVYRMMGVSCFHDVTVAIHVTEVGVLSVQLTHVTQVGLIDVKSMSKNAKNLQGLKAIA